MVFLLADVFKERYVKSEHGIERVNNVFDAIGLGENLSPTRSNGLVAMIKQMRMYALAFKTKLGN